SSFLGPGEFRGTLSVTGASAFGGRAEFRAELAVGAPLTVLTGSNPIRFTGGWSGFPDGARNQADIANDPGGHQTLLSVGNKSNDGNPQRVSAFDRPEVGAGVAVAGASSLGANASGGATATRDELDVGAQLPVLTGSNPIRFTGGWSAFPD